MKANNIFSQVINQQPDEDELIQNISNKTIINSNIKFSIKNLSSTQNKLQIIQENKFNNIIIQIKNIIKNVKDKIQQFASNDQKRSIELGEYNKKLQQLSQMLNYCIGLQNVIKIFVLKKVLNILKSMKKIQINEYQKLLAQIEIQQKLQNNQQSNHSQNNRLTQKSLYEIRTKKSFTTLSHQKEGFISNYLKQSQFTELKDEKTNQQKKYSQALQRMNKVYQKNLTNWYSNNQNIRELQSLEKQIRYNKNTFNNKSFQNRNIMKRPRSLKIISNQILNQQDKIQNIKNNTILQTNKLIKSSSKSLKDNNILILGAHPLVSLYEQQRKYKIKKHVEHTISFKPVSLNPKNLLKINKENSKFNLDMDRTALEKYFRKDIQKISEMRLNFRESNSTKNRKNQKNISKIKKSQKKKVNKLKINR